jgi:hypothetical protein
VLKWTEKVWVWCELLLVLVLVLVLDSLVVLGLGLGQQIGAEMGQHAVTVGVVRNKRPFADVCGGWQRQAVQLL